MSFYADKLCLSPKYLSAVSKSICGYTVQELVFKAIIRKSISLLKNTQKDIQDPTRCLEILKSVICFLVNFIYEYLPFPTKIDIDNLKYVSSSDSTDTNRYINFDKLNYTSLYNNDSQEDIRLVNPFLLAQ